MYVKEILKSCLLRAGKENLIDKATPTQQDTDEIEKFLNAFNTVFRDISINYLPQTMLEEIIFVDGEAQIDGLSEDIYLPKYVEQNGNKIKYTTTARGLKANNVNGKVKLCYSYIPKLFQLNSEVPNLKISPNAIEAGVLSEYFFQVRAYDLAKEYDTKYRSEMTVAKYKGKEIRVKERSW